MSAILAILGVIIITCISLDLILTTIHSGGAGFIAGPLSAWIFHSVKVICGNNRSHWLLNYAGLIVVFVVLTFWVAGLWIGFDLLYLAREDSLIAQSTGKSASFWEKFYYAGYSLSTLGIGDVVPNSDGYRVITILNALTGLVLITLSVTYLVPVLSAVSFKRKLSTFIYHMGGTPVEILRNGWDGKQFTYLEPCLQELNGMILLYSENHLVYPVLHYFHRNKEKFSTQLNLVKLDEALTIALNVFPRESLGNPLLFESTKKSLTTYLGTVGHAFVKPADEVPPAKYEEELKRHFEGVDYKYDSQAFESQQERRKLLLQLVRTDGQEWDAMHDLDRES